MEALDEGYAIAAAFEDLADVLAALDHVLGDGLAAADNNDDAGDDDWDDDWDAFGNADNFGLAVPPHGYDDPLVVFRDLRLMGFGFADLNPDLAARVHRRLVQGTTRGRPEGHCVYHAARKFPGQKAEVTESDDDSYEEVPWVPKGDSIRARRKWSTARKSGLVGGGFPVYGSFGPSGFEF